MSRKYIIVVVLSVVATLGAAALGWIYGRPAYRRYQETQAIRAAQTAWEKRDFGQASVAARKALQLNPRNLEACEIMAQLAEAARVPQALDWRRKVVEIGPTLDNKFRLASCALKYELAPFPTASQVVGEAMSTASNNPVTHALAAELALRMNNSQAAARHFEIASRLDPQSEGYQFNLAVLRLDTPEASVSGEARKVLETMRAKPQWQEAALRWLVADRLKHEDMPAAQRFSEELIAAPKKSFDDQLQHLRVLKSAGDTNGFEQALGGVQREASTNGVLAYAFTTWTLQHGSQESALQFLDRLPADVQSSQPAAMAYVECYVQAKDWMALEEFLQDKKWGEQEFVRLALLSRCASEQNNDRAADTRWRSAIREAGNRLPALVNLVGQAKAAGRDAASEELLWHIYQRHPREKWTLLELDRHYTRLGNTRGLHRIYSILGAADTNNLVAQNNLAATSLLLNVEVEKAHAIARDIHVRCPTNPTIASTYAFSLHQQGRTGEGLEILQAIEPAARAKPPVALYYGVLLASTGRTNEAIPYLATARESASLPEEKILAENALH